MKVWVLHTQWKDEDGFSDNNVTLFSNEASASKYLDEMVDREAEWWHNHINTDFNKDVFARNGNYDLDERGNLVKIDTNLVCNMYYRIKRNARYFLVADNFTGHATEFIILEQEVID